MISYNLLSKIMLLFRLLVEVIFITCILFFSINGVSRRVFGFFRLFMMSAVQFSAVFGFRLGFFRRFSAVFGFFRLFSAFFGSTFGFRLNFRLSARLFSAFFGFFRLSARLSAFFGFFF